MQYDYDSWDHGTAPSTTPAQTELLRHVDAQTFGATPAPVFKPHVTSMLEKLATIRQRMLADAKEYLAIQRHLLPEIDNDDTPTHFYLQVTSTAIPIDLPGHEVKNRAISIADDGSVRIPFSRFLIAAIVVLGIAPGAMAQAPKRKLETMIEITGAPSTKPITKEEKAARKAKADADAAKLIAKHKAQTAAKNKHFAELRAKREQAIADQNPKIGDRATTIPTIGIVNTKDVWSLGRLARAGDAQGIDLGIKNGALKVIKEGTHIILLNRLVTPGSTLVYWQCRMIDGDHEGQLLNVFQGTFHIGIQ